MPTTSPLPSWPRRLLDRWGNHVALKSVAIPLFFVAFFVGYFHLLRHPRLPITIMPAGALDRLAGFHPAALVPYLSLWFYVTIAPSLLRGRREIVAYCLGVGLLTAVGFGTFFLWSTAAPRTGVDWAEHPSFGFLKTFDASGNACPSLHVAFAVFTAVWLDRMVREMGRHHGLRAVNLAWCAAIVYSTLATKQHVTVDALAGIALGGAGGLFDPRPPGTALAAPYSRLNRLGLALTIAVAAKLFIFTLGPAALSPWVIAGLFLGPDLWILTGLLVPNATMLMPTATRFATARREVWLTIDDGPEPATTRPMLDLLDRHAAKATFFVIGEKARAHPELVREIARRGHTLGNHTQTHPLAAFWMAGPWRTAREVDGGEGAIRAAGVTPAAWFRPPAGTKTFFLRGVLAARGYMLIGWSARGRETVSASIEAPLRRLKRRLRPGAILLTHESGPHGPARVALMAALLEHLAAEGYRCVLPKRATLR